MDDAQNIKNPDLAFRFGFLLRRRIDSLELDFLRNWRRINIGGFLLQLHPDTRITQVATEHDIVMLIGDAFSCTDNRSINDILMGLLYKFDWDDFDSLAGRFVLLMVCDDECKIVHDPFGSRTVYYRSTGPFGVASHAALLASVFGTSIDKATKSFVRTPEYTRRGTSYLPGDATMYADIKALIPNNFFDSSLRKSVRFWPRRSVNPVSMVEFLEVCDLYFEKFAYFIHARYKPVLGVTGGVDTRAVIAGLRGKGLETRLVTWSGGRLPDNEVSVVRKMAAHLRQPHEYLDPKAKITTEGLKRVAESTSAATGFCRGTAKALVANMGSIAKPGDVFIRGYGGEIIRGFYNRHGHSLSNNIISDFFGLYKTSRISMPSQEFVRFATGATEGFVDRANYSASFFNLDIMDIYYWEQRMGVWGANMHNEMDPAMYSITGFNSRPLYEAAFGLPESERLGTDIMIKITALYDQKLARLGVKS